MANVLKSNSLHELLTRAKEVQALYEWRDLGDVYVFRSEAGTFRVRPADSARFLTALIRRREIEGFMPKRAA